MKPIFKCEYCNFMGDEDQVREHEPTCLENYDKKSCNTCVYKQTHVEHNIGSNKINPYYTCEKAIEIPKGQLWEFCESYERKEKIKYDMNGIFGNLFGGGF